MCRRTKLCTAGALRARHSLCGRVQARHFFFRPMQRHPVGMHRAASACQHARRASATGGGGGQEGCVVGGGGGGACQGGGGGGGGGGASQGGGGGACQGGGGASQGGGGGLPRWGGGLPKVGGGASQGGGGGRCTRPTATTCIPPGGMCVRGVWGYEHRPVKSPPLTMKQEKPCCRDMGRGRGRGAFGAPKIWGVLCVPPHPMRGAGAGLRIPHYKRGVCRGGGVTHNTAQAHPRGRQQRRGQRGWPYP